MRPAPDEYAQPFARYIDRVAEDDVVSAMEQQSSETQKLLASLDETRASHRYAEDKWSIREVIGHILDGERVFVYRALCVSRAEQQSLPGFDENQYAQYSNYDQWKVGDLAELYAVVRRATILFFKNLPDEAWDRRGVANDREISVRALAYVIAGHERHHLSVLRDRYKV